MQHKPFISLIIPSRYRKELLVKCLRSFYEKCSQKKLIEFIVLVDLDDDDTQKFLLEQEYLWNNNLSIIIRKQGRNINDHYMNFGAKCAQGQFIWFLNDECICKTKNWDVELLKIYKDKIEKSTDKIFYIVIDDGTHWKNQELFVGNGSAFLILTREFVKVMDWAFPPQIESHGADVALWGIFVYLKNFFKIDKICLLPSIAIDHVSSNNQSIIADSVQKRTSEMGKTTGLRIDEIEYYARILAIGIMNLATKELNISLGKYFGKI